MARRKQLTNQQRLAICKFAVANPSLKQREIQRHFADLFNIPFSQGLICRTLQRKEELFKDEEMIMLRNPTRKTKREFEEVETILFTWYDCKRDKSDVTGELLKEKAAQIAKRIWPQRKEKHAKEDWSNGWLQGFRERFGLSGRYKKKNDEQQSSSSTMTTTTTTTTQALNRANVRKILIGLEYGKRKEKEFGEAEERRESVAIDQNALRNIQQLIRWVTEQQSGIDRGKRLTELIELQKDVEQIARQRRIITHPFGHGQ